MTGKRHDYTEAEKSAGLHCVDRLQRWPYAMNSVLDKRMGEQIDDRVAVSLIKITPGPLRSDGTHKLTVLYQVNRIGEHVPPPRKAMGTLNNADCAFKLTLFER